jgi:hypothetical protein
VPSPPTRSSPSAAAAAGFPSCDRLPPGGDGAITPRVPDSRITRDDVISTVGARRELGDEMEPEVVDAFLQRVEHAIDTRVDRRVADDKAARVARDRDGTGVALAVVSLGTGIPITAIAGDEAGLAGIVVAWLGIVGVNVAHALRK